MAKRLWAEGLFLVGLDVIGSKVTEINVTSPPASPEIKAQTGFDVAAMFIPQPGRCSSPESAFLPRRSNFPVTIAPN